MANNYTAMSETAYYILLSLLEERHGYGIMLHVSELTKGRINLGAGTIYGTLGKLEKGNLIKTTREEDKRKYYVITEEGRLALTSEVLRIQELYDHGKVVIDNGSKYKMREEILSSSSK